MSAAESLRGFRRQHKTTAGEDLAYAAGWVAQSLRAAEGTGRRLTRAEQRELLALLDEATNQQVGGERS